MNLDKFKNKLIVLEGVDFCGKTTVGKMLVDHLNENGIPSIFTFQPGDPEYGVNATLFRSLCKDKRHNIHPLTNFFIFFADKVEQAHKVILPALKVGKTVVSDRWWHSTYAYQFYGKKVIEEYGMTEHMGQWLNLTSTLGLMPDIVYYFHEQIKKHKREEDKNDMFDAAADEYKNTLKDAYERLYSNHSNMKKVSSGSSAEKTLQNLLKISF